MKFPRQWRKLDEEVVQQGLVLARPPASVVSGGKLHHTRCREAVTNYNFRPTHVSVLIFSSAADYRVTE